MKNKNEIKKILQKEELKARSTWSKAVLHDALDLLENIKTEFLPLELEKALLNGASDWREYSYGGCALIYDIDIAQHYCTPSKLKSVTHTDGSIRTFANKNENWLDVQARALFQACAKIKKIAQ